MPYGYFDPTYILVLIGVVISLLASAGVKSTFAKYSKVRAASGLTGAQAAERVLRSAGIYDVRIERTEGNLTDHYDPKGKTLRLSDSVYDNNSVAAIGVAAHECGHAIQDQQSYVPLRFRAAFVPVANIGASAAWPLIIIGLFLNGSEFLITLGIIMFSLAVLFHIITLPVEFNASKKAVAVLGDAGVLYGDELVKARKVLSAAAFTYIASAAAMVLQLLRLLLLFGKRRD